MKLRHTISTTHAPSAWKRALSTGCDIVTLPARQVVLHLRKLRGQSCGDSVRVDGEVPFREFQESAPFNSRPPEGGERISSHLERPVLFASGLDELERICDARRRDRANPEPRLVQPVQPAPALEVLTVMEGMTEITGIWFERGRVRGTVTVDATPERGWFETYTSESA